MRLLSYVVLALAADAAIASSWFSKAGEFELSSSSSSSLVLVLIVWSCEPHVFDFWISR